jgi:glycosyltransferase involved in cell wall biosynthesis
MSGPLVSIVIPFFNTEHYLGDAIRSVLDQTHENWELILLNNQSSDDSRAIAHAYEQRDPRIRLEDTPRFLSQAANYNHALTLISDDSRYTKVVQADDWIYPECLERMIAVADSDPAIGIVAAYALEGRRLICDGLPLPSQSVDGSVPCRLYFFERLFVFGSPTSVLYRSCIVRERRPFFSETSPHDDTEACFEILRSWRFGFVHQVLAFLRVEEGSIFARLKPYDPPELDRLVYLAKYGAAFLSQAELRERLDTARREYYRRLCRDWTRLADRDYRRFHRAMLAEAGLAIDPVRLGLSLAARAVYAATNPGQLCLRLARWLQGALRRSSR